MKLQIERRLTLGHFISDIKLLDLDGNKLQDLCNDTDDKILLIFIKII